MESSSSWLFLNLTTHDYHIQMNTLFLLLWESGSGAHQRLFELFMVFVISVQIHQLSYSSLN